MGLKQKTIKGIIAVEGGYVNDPSDSGGETNFGITVAVARANWYEGPMRDMQESVAFDIYARQYWDAMHGDQLVELSEPVATEVIDTAVNMGTGRAGRFLQRALNVLSKGKALKVDGRVGPSTVGALRAYLKRRDEKTLVKALDCLQGAFYIELAERREKDQRFIYGWLKHRVGL
jgi:lysozyme family protein